jgi:hypothetical protein
MEGNCEDKLTSISWHVAQSATGKYKNDVVTTIGTSLLNLGLFGFIGNHGSRKSHKFYGLGDQLNSAGYHE